MRASCIVSSMPATVSRGLSSRWISDSVSSRPGEALEREVLRLHGHDHAVGRDQRVDGQRPERRRAVEQDVLEAVAHAARGRRAGDARSPAGAAAPSSRPRDRASRRSSDRRSTPVGADRLLGGRVAAEHVVEPDALGAVGADADGGVALRIDVDEQRVEAGLRDARGDVDRGGGLADPALLVGDGVHGAHSVSDASGADGGSRLLDAVSTRFQRRFFTDSGRFVAIPGRRGKLGGVGAILRATQSVRRSDPANGRTARRRLLLEAEQRRGRGAVGALRPPSTAPFHATTTPPSRSSGAAYSYSDRQRGQRPCGDDVARARAVAPLLRAHTDDLDVREPHRRVPRRG